MKNGNITKYIKVNSSQRVNIAKFSTQTQEIFLVNYDRTWHRYTHTAAQTPHFTDKWSMIRHPVSQLLNEHTQIMYTNRYYSL